jgi:hypothetical protein
VGGLQAGALGEEIEARLRGVTEPSVEKLKEVLREEGRFLARNPRKDGEETGRRLNDNTPAEPGGILEGPRNRKKLLMEADQKAEKASMCRMWTTRRELYRHRSRRDSDREKMRPRSSSSTWTSCVLSWSWPCWEATPAR